jgi:phage tail sheath protein FI
MATQFTYPGVYIQEFAPPAPIQPAGTSTAAFIGPTALGAPNTPVKVISMDEFVASFGSEPLDGFYLWYAVQGFFRNGGQVCYIVRASNGSYATAQLNDSSPAANALINVQALQLGNLSPAISVTASAASVFSAAVYQPTAVGFTVSGANEITLSDNNLAAQFRPSDSVNLGATLGDHAIARILPQQTTPPVNVRFRFNDSLNTPVGTSGTLRLSDYPAGSQTFRLSYSSGSVVPPGLLVPGTMLTFTQGASDTEMVDTVQAEYLGMTPPTVTYRVRLRRGLAIAISETASASVASNEFTLTVTQGTSSSVYPNLSIDPAHPRYYPQIVDNDPNAIISVQPVAPPPTSAPPLNLPAAATATLTGGLDESLPGLAPADYLNALAALEQIQDVNQIAIPDCTTLNSNTDVQAVQQGLITHCEQLGNRFAVLDSQPGLQPFIGAYTIETQRAALDSARGYAALYYPWLSILGVRPGPPILVPPSGHMCGIMASIDASRGVYKAPANVPVAGALGLERTMSDADQGQLNILGINCIRVFPGSSVPVVWGARTTSPDTNWQYVNVRRLFLFLENSIRRGIQWAVFEPNTTGLWSKLNRTLTAFLTQVWRDGGLFGDTAAQAFYVRIDESLNPESTRALGQLYIQIGVAPAYPAEFVIVQIGIWQGGSNVSES